MTRIQSRMLSTLGAFLIGTAFGYSAYSFFAASPLAAVIIGAVISGASNLWLRVVVFASKEERIRAKLKNHH
jgi:hypothetical protein